MASYLSELAGSSCSFLLRILVSFELDAYNYTQKTSLVVSSWSGVPRCFIIAVVASVLVISKATLSSKKNYLNRFSSSFGSINDCLQVC